MPKIQVDHHKKHPSGWFALYLGILAAHLLIINLNLHFIPLLGLMWMDCIAAIWLGLGTQDKAGHGGAILGLTVLIFGTMLLMIY